MIISVLLPGNAISDAFVPSQISVTPMEDSVIAISGNLTATIMKNWPRVVFQHTSSRFSPTFDFSVLELRLYNLTADELIANPTIDEPELIAPAHLLSWSFSINELDYSPEKGQHLLAKLSAVIDLYSPTARISTADEDIVKVRENWGILEIHFEISQYGIGLSDPHPSLTVRAAHCVDINISIRLNESNEFKAISIERNFQAGGPTYLARIYPGMTPGTTYSEEVSTRENELSDSTYIVHEIPSGGEDWQMISLSTAHGVEQSLSAWNCSSKMLAENGETTDSCPWYYRTTGTSVTLFSLSSLGNDTEGLEIEQLVAIIDEGFDQPIKNILLDFLPFIVGLSVLIPSILLIYRFGRIRKASRIINHEGNGKRS